MSLRNPSCSRLPTMKNWRGRSRSTFRASPWMQICLDLYHKSCRRRSRQGLIDFLEEKDNYRNIRFEYQFLLKLFGVGRITKASAIDVQPTSPIAGPAHDLATPYDDLLRHIHRIDDLASHYARLYRSSTTSGSILTIVAAFISATVIIVYPSITGVSLFVQMAVNGLVIFDSRARATQRWQERW